MTRIVRPHLSIVLALLLSGVVALPVQGAKVRNSARTSVNQNKNVNVNRNTNVNRNVNVNTRRDVDVHRDVDIDVHGGCCYHDDYHPVATAAAITATAMVTAAVIGSMVNTLPPSCTVVMVNGLTYQQCGSTWYQPQISGSSTTYIVVSSPR